jgi:hypothetical protein
MATELLEVPTLQNGRSTRIPTPSRIALTAIAPNDQKALEDLLVD